MKTSRCPLIIQNLRISKMTWMEAGSSVWLSRWFEDSASIDESENSSSINCALHPQWLCQMSGGKCWNSYLERCNYQWSKTDQHFNNTTYVLMLHNLLNHHDLSFWKKAPSWRSCVFPKYFVPISFQFRSNLVPCWCFQRADWHWQPVILPAVSCR